MNTTQIFAIGMPGGQEWFLIFLAILLLFGAKKLPEFARGLGRSMGEFKKARQEFEHEINKSVEEKDTKAILNACAPGAPLFAFSREPASLRAPFSFCTAAPAADEPPPVTFVAWNLRNYLHTAGAPAVRAPRDTKPKPPEEIAAVTKILAALRPDILGVCEMGSREDLAALQQRLRETGLDLPHSEWVEAADTDRHLALLSRFPIVARQPQTKLSYLLDESKLPVQRGFLDVTLQVTADYQFRCIGTHLKSRRDVPEANEALMRRNEAHLLRQYVDGILTKAPETNLLVYGDFNDTRDQPPVRAVAGARTAETYLTPVASADDAGQRWTYFFTGSDTYSRIDFLLASKGLNPELDDGQSRIYSGRDWSQASDHRAITAIIRPRDAKPHTRKPAAKPE